MKFLWIVVIGLFMGCSTGIKHKNYKPLKPITVSTIGKSQVQPEIYSFTTNITVLDTEGVFRKIPVIAVNDAPKPTKPVKSTKSNPSLQPVIEKPKLSVIVPDNTPTNQFYIIEPILPLNSESIKLPEEETDINLYWYYGTLAAAGLGYLLYKKYKKTKKQQNNKIKLS